MLVTKLAFGAPETEGAADILGPNAGEHADVVLEIAPAIEQAFHGDGTGQVVFQYLARYGPVKLIAAGPIGGPLQLHHLVLAAARHVLCRLPAGYGDELLDTLTLDIPHIDIALRVHSQAMGPIQIARLILSFLAQGNGPGAGATCRRC